MLPNLKLLRAEKQLSQKALGAIVGVSQQSINKYENHKIEPDINTLCKLAAHFDVSIDFIVGYTHIRQQNDGTCESLLADNESAILQLFRRLPANVQKDFYNLMQDYFSNTKGIA